MSVPSNLVIMQPKISITIFLVFFTFFLSHFWSHARNTGINHRPDTIFAIMSWLLQNQTVSKPFHVTNM